MDGLIAAAQATTRPAAGQPAPTPELLASEAKSEALLVKAKKVIVDSHTAGTAIAPVLAALANGDNPGPAITSAAPLAGPYATYVALAGIVITTGWGIWQSIAKGNAIKAGQTAVDAIQSAIASGQIVVTSVQAGKAVDAIAASHPTNDRLVDVIDAAPVVAKAGA